MKYLTQYFAHHNKMLNLAFFACSQVENVEKLSKFAGCTEEHRCFLVNFADKETEDEKTVMDFFQDNYDCVPQPIVNV
jgi:hypothetical protein